MRKSLIHPIIQILRPAHWIKNLFLFAPLVFSGNLFHLGNFLRSGVAFFSFLLLASGGYVLNDIFDLEADRKHPVKQLRPLPSGALSIQIAFWLALSLLLGSWTIAFLLSKNFVIVVIVYFLLNLVYSKWLKHFVILDVFAIAAFFLFRVIGGGVVIGVWLSHWLLICVALLALFLGFSKRRHELTLLGEEAINHRGVLQHYNPYFLDRMLSIITTCTIVSYALYTIDNQTVQRFGTNKLLLTTPFVLYGIFRYQYLVYHKNKGGCPTKELLTDIPLLVDVVLWGVAVVVVIYLTGKL